jgi:TorA maturation chaperone TorD
MLHPATDSQATVVAPVPSSLRREDFARANFYALLARLLLSPPDAEFLSRLAHADSLPAEQAQHPLEIAWETLVLSAAIMDRYAVEEEFDALFVSVSAPRINPNASYYVAGFLNEEPLALLRIDLAKLGFARKAGSRESEDHLGALCEAMRLLIVRSAALEQQRTFFHTHLLPWAGRCLTDIAAAPEANFYRLVAELGKAFIAVEAQAFEMEDA